MRKEEKFLKKLVKLIEEDEAGRTELIPEKINCVDAVYDALCYSVGKMAKVEYEIGETFSSVAIITITGKDIVVKNADLFARAISIADNFEVYPKTNGSVQMNLAFYGVARR